MMYPLVWALAVLAAGAVVTALIGRRSAAGWTAVLFMAAAGVLALSSALGRMFSGGEAEQVQLLSLGSLGANLIFGLDAFSALFVVLLVVVALSATFYSVRYLEAYPRQSPRRYYPFLLLSVAAMLAVASVRDWMFFLVFWELMGLTTYLLVVFESDQPSNLRAGLKYLLMTHVGTTAMIAAALVVWHATEPRSFGFQSVASALAQLWHTQPVLFHVLLALWFVGFATKAGVFPLGDWLPDAHPAAPAPISALLSGMTIKFGIYGIVRVFLGVLPLGGAQSALYPWGVTIALLGAVSAVIGSLTAVRQGRAKRLLAFSSVAQVGFILLALGVGMGLLGLGLPLAMVALAAALFHLVNDALFKPLLFFGAGALYYRTHTDDLNQVGGLLRFLPVTALATVAGVLALAGVPPFNGFASKWLIYQTALLGAPPSVPAAHILFAALAVGALFVSLVSLAYGLEFAGTAFLGKTVVPQGEEAPAEVPASMLAPQVFLAAACIVIGLVPGPVVKGLWQAVAQLASMPGPGPEFRYQTVWGGLRLLSGHAQPTSAWLPVPFLAAGALVLVVAVVVKALSPAGVREVPAWYGGEQVADSEIRFHAHGFYRPFADAVRNVYPTLGLPHGGRPRTLESAFDTDVWLFRPLVRLGQGLVDSIRRTHAGLPQMYLIWQVVGAVAVLVVLVLLLGGG
jgi:hydrogenase-4 component B